MLTVLDPTQMSLTSFMEPNLSQRHLQTSIWASESSTQGIERWRLTRCSQRSRCFNPIKKTLICKFCSLYLSTLVKNAWLMNYDEVFFGWFIEKITYLQVSFLQMFLRLVWLLFDGLEWNVFFQICLVTACQASQVSRIVPAAFEPMVWSSY